MASSVAPFPSSLSRNSVVACGVVLAHLAAFWALQAGLHPAAPGPVIVPIQMLSATMQPPAPKLEPPTPAAAPAPAPVQPRPVVRPVERPHAVPHREPHPVLHRTPPPTPRPVAIAEPATAPAAADVAAPPLPAPPVASAISKAPAASVAPAAPAKIELPSSNADYLQNPKPPYPPISKRLGEQGRVVVSVLIGADGRPEKAELKRSSGFERLDRVALETVMKWRYVPGKRGGVAEAMWVNVPIDFVLE